MADETLAAYDRYRQMKLAAAAVAQQGAAPAGALGHGL